LTNEIVPQLGAQAECCDRTLATGNLLSGYQAVNMHTSIYGDTKFTHAHTHTG